jgi:hypothetical protein
VYWLSPLRLGAVTEALLVVLGTLAACLLGGELARRVGILRPLFGLKPRPRSGRAQPEALPVVGRGE